jgi:hypothetical protein
MPMRLRQPHERLVSELSKRELIAAMAMQGLLAHEGASDTMLGATTFSTAEFARDDAVRACAYADALLTELARSKL